jgi:hypothetical protein
MRPKPQLRAKVTFLTPDQGGFARPKQSGVRPHMKVNDVFTSCYVWGDSEDQVFELGVEYEVGLELLCWKDYRHEIHAGMPLQLNQGSQQVVGRGTILAIIGEP